MADTLCDLNMGTVGCGESGIYYENKVTGELRQPLPYINGKPLCRDPIYQDGWGVLGSVCFDDKDTDDNLKPLPYRNGLPVCHDPLFDTGALGDTCYDELGRPIDDSYRPNPDEDNPEEPGELPIEEIPNGGFDNTENTTNNDDEFLKSGEYFE